MNAIARRAELACRLAELLRLADQWQTEHPVGAARRVREQADGEQ